MPRRLRRTRPATSTNIAEVLQAENEQLRADLEAARKKLEAEKFQLTWHKEQLAKAKQVSDVATTRAADLGLAVDRLTEALKRERQHTAGSCSHAAELRAMSTQVAALERRVHELQQANIARDVFELAGWESDAEIQAAPVRKALGRGQG